MAGEAEAVVQGIATEENVTVLMQIASDLFSFAAKMVADAWALVQENFVWGIVILLLTKAVDMWVLQPYTPIPGGWIRYGVAFLLVMFCSFLFVPFLQGWIG